MALRMLNKKDKWRKITLKKASGISVYVLLEKDTDSLKLLMTVRDLGRGKEVRELVTHLEAVMG